MKKIISLAIVSGVLASSSFSQSSYGLSAGGGFYFPSSSLLRDAFGDSWTRISFSPGSSRSASGSRLDFDVQVISRDSNSNRLFIIAPTIGYSQSLGNNQKGFVPYVAARVGPAFADYRISSISRRETLLNTNFEVGATLGDRFRVFGRYDAFGKRNGVDFSGFSINAEWLFASF